MKITQDTDGRTKQLRTPSSSLNQSSPVTDRTTLSSDRIGNTACQQHGIIRRISQSLRLMCILFMDWRIRRSDHTFVVDWIQPTQASIHQKDDDADKVALVALLVLINYSHLVVQSMIFRQSLSHAYHAPEGQRVGDSRFCIQFILHAADFRVSVSLVYRAVAHNMVLRLACVV